MKDWGEAGGKEYCRGGNLGKRLLVCKLKDGE